MEENRITGSIVQAFVVCPRQAWFLLHRISGDQKSTFIQLGRIIAEKTFTKDKKEILLEGVGKIDILRKTGDITTLIEVKKSSKRLKATKMQLMFYMYYFRDKVEGKLRGEIRIPKEKKVVEVSLTEDDQVKVEQLIYALKKLLKEEQPPKIKSQNCCKTCSFSEFCWS